MKALHLHPPTPQPLATPLSTNTHILSEDPIAPDCSTSTLLSVISVVGLTVHYLEHETIFPASVVAEPFSISPFGVAGPEENRPPLVGSVNGYPSTFFQNLTTSDQRNSTGLGVGFPSPSYHWPTLCWTLCHPLHPLPSTPLFCYSPTTVFPACLHSPTSRGHAWVSSIDTCLHSTVGTGREG